MDLESSWVSASETFSLTDSSVDKTSFRHHWAGVMRGRVKDDTTRATNGRENK